jgi:hypothetical protein
MIAPDFRSCQRIFGLFPSNFALAKPEGSQVAGSGSFISNIEVVEVIRFPLPVCSAKVGPFG